MAGPLHVPPELRRDARSGDEEASVESAVDGDGDPDIYVLQGSNATVPDLLLLNQGSGVSYTNFSGLPQVTLGEGDRVEAIPGWKGTRNPPTRYPRPACSQKGPSTRSASKYRSAISRAAAQCSA
jgi:hypothetical protein